MSNHLDFYQELADRYAALEDARANRAEDPETYDRVQAEYAAWRRGIRLLAGRPLGGPPWPEDVRDFMRNNPDDPRCVAAREELASQHAAELEALGG